MINPVSTDSTRNCTVYLLWETVNPKRVTRAGMRLHEHSFHLLTSSSINAVYTRNLVCLRVPFTIRWISVLVHQSRWRVYGGYIWDSKTFKSVDFVDFRFFKVTRLIQPKTVLKLEFDSFWWLSPTKNHYEDCSKFSSRKSMLHKTPNSTKDFNCMIWYWNSVMALRFWFFYSE